MDNDECCICKNACQRTFDENGKCQVFIKCRLLLDKEKRQEEVQLASAFVEKGFTYKYTQ